MPIKTWNAAGTLIFDSDAVRGGVCFDRLTYAVGASGTKSYPTLTGATIRAVDISGSPQPGVTVDYPGGVPRVTVVATGYTRELMVWALSSPSVAPSVPGIQAVKADGALALTPEGFGLHHIGTPALYSQTANATSPWLGGTSKALGKSVFRITSAAPIVAVIELEADKCSRLLDVQNIGGNVWEIQAWHCHKTNTDATGLATQHTPTIHVFARPSSALNNPRCAMFDAAGNVLWDLMRPGLLTYHDAPTFGATDTTKAIASVTRYGALSHPGDNFATAVSAGFYLGDRVDLVTESDWFWTAASSTSLERKAMIFQQYRDFEPGANFGGNPGVREPLVVNLAGL